MKKDILLVFLFAFVLRCIQMVTAGYWEHPLKDEPSEVVVLAQGLAKGWGYITPARNSAEYVNDPSAYQPPGYPVLLASMIKVFAWLNAGEMNAYRLAHLINVFLGALTVVVLAVAPLARFGRLGFWFAGLTSAVWPTLIQNALKLWDTSFALLGLAIGLYLVMNPRTRIHPVVFGFVTGITALFNPVMAVMPGLALAAHVLIQRRESIFSRHFLLPFSVAFLCVMPWIARNWIVFDRFIPMRNTFGLSMYIGNLPECDGSVDTWLPLAPFDNLEERDVLTGMGEDLYMQMRAKDAITLIRDDPSGFFHRSSHRVVLYWLGHYGKPTHLLGIRFPMIGGVNLLKALFNTLLLVLAIWGSWYWSRRSGLGVCWFAVLLMSLPFYVTHVGPNYRVYADPVLIMLASGIPGHLFRSGIFQRTGDRHLSGRPVGNKTRPTV